MSPLGKANLTKGFDIVTLKSHKGLDEEILLLEKKIDRLLKKCRDLKFKNIALEEIQASFLDEQSLEAGMEKNGHLIKSTNASIVSADDIVSPV